MVLYHIPDSPGLLVVRTSALYAKILCHRNLDMVNVAPVPHRLKNTVSQAEDQDILHRFFTQVVVDTVDLLFLENPANLAVKFACRCQVMSKGLLDDDTCPPLTASIQAGSSKTPNDFRILAAGSWKVE